MLEEANIPYLLFDVNFMLGETHTKKFHKLTIVEKIPVIIDESENNLAVFESGAILIYLAEKSGKFLPNTPKARAKVMQWLMYQMSTIAPMCGQAAFFRFAKKQRTPEVRERYEGLSKVIFSVVEEQLTSNKYLAGNRYSIADMASYFWLDSHHLFGININKFPYTKAWLKTLSQRPAYKKVKIILKPDFNPNNEASIQRFRKELEQKSQSMKKAS